MDGGPLEVRLLGELELVRDGKALPLPASKKSRALLGYLCATAVPHRREQLCELLWEGPDDPRAALRWSLTKLRPLLDEHTARRLDADREHAGFEPRDASVDLLQVRLLTAPGVSRAPLEDLVAAAGLMRGPLLEGLELTSSHGFHAWWVAEREEARNLHLRLLLELCRRLEDRPEEALPHARALVALDPLAESSHMAVIRILARMGRPREALEQYERCRQVLADELGTLPSQDLERLRMSLTARAGSVAPAASDARPTREKPERPVSARPLVGRIAEKRRIDEALAAPGGALLLVTGEPGVGKTRLLEELRQRAAATGALVLWGRAFEAELARPYGVFVDALRGAPIPPDFPRSELGALLPELGAPRDLINRTRLFEAVKELVVQLAEAQPVVMVVDDLHWLDEASAALLHFVARGVAGGKTLFAAGARPGEIADNPPVTRLLRGLDQEKRLVRLPLAPLDEASIEELVLDLAPRGAGSQVFQASEGNPLLALEVARAMDGSGRVPGAGLDAILGERVEKLEEPARRLLPWAAALGRSFAPELLGHVSGVAPADLIAALEQFERYGFLRASGAAGPAGGYDFAHDLVRQTVYRRMSEPRRRMVHLQIARALSTLRDPDGTLAGEIARHAGLGGDDDAAAVACARAAERCLRLFAHVEAAEVASRGLHHARRLSRERQLELMFPLLRAQAMNPLLRGRRAGELRADLTRVTLEARDAGLGAEAALGLYLRSVVAFDEGDFKGAYASALDAAMQRMPADPREAAERIGSIAKCLVMIEKDVPRAEGLLQSARALVNGDGTNMLEFTWAEAVMASYRGDAPAATRALERARDLARARSLRWDECDCLTRLAMVELEAGHFPAALERCAELLPVAERLEGTERQVAGALQGVARLSLGQTEGREALERGLSALRELDAKGMLAYVQNLAAELDLRQGDGEGARTRATEALAAASAVERGSQVALASATLALEALSRGEAGEARERITAVAAQAQDPLALSARARDAVAQVIEKLEA